MPRTAKSQSSPPPSETDFTARSAEHRGELRLYCYRMLGSVLDAEDAMQETMLRAWRFRDSLREAAALRAWLYRIATNVCRDILAKRPPRLLPSDSLPPSEPGATEMPGHQDLAWLTPVPDKWLVDDTPGPEAIYSARESIALAFLTLVQTLPPQQRSVLLLRDAAGWPAKEVATVLGLTVLSVESALQRARTTIQEQGQMRWTQATAQEGQRQLLDQYVLAWETGDIETLLTLLKQDATFTMPPEPTWYKGQTAIGTFLGEKYAKFRFRLRPTTANGLPAFALYKGAADRSWQQHAIQLVRTDVGLISEIHTFLTGANVPLFRVFGLPTRIETA